MLDQHGVREYVARCELSIYTEYVDDVSGDLERLTAHRQNDSAYRERMADAARRAFDRFARSLVVLVSALQQFSTPWIDFISYTQNIDMTTPMARLFQHVIGAFAELNEK